MSMLEYHYIAAKYIFESALSQQVEKALTLEVHHRTAVHGSGRLHINHGTCIRRVQAILFPYISLLDRLVASPDVRQWRVVVIATILFGRGPQLSVSLGILPELKL